MASFHTQTSSQPHSTAEPQLLTWDHIEHKEQKRKSYLYPKERTGNVKKYDSRETLMEMFCADLAQILKKTTTKKSMLLVHQTWQRCNFQHVLQPGVSVKPWGQQELNLSLGLGCIYIANWCCNHSVWILVSQTSGPLPQVCSVCLTAAPEGEHGAPEAQQVAMGCKTLQTPAPPEVQPFSTPEIMSELSNRYQTIKWF